MKANKTAEQVSELMTEFFGINPVEVNTMTAREAAMQKMSIYQREDEIGRAQLYAIEVTEHENLKRSIAAFSQEFIVTVRTLGMFEHVPAAFKRETMKFFNSHFPSFDKNAANALGQHFKKSIEYIKSIPGALLEKGRSEHLSNDVMSRLIKRSNNAFFRRVKADSKLRDQFKARLDKYCAVVWAAVMQEEGTIYSDSSLADRIARRNKTARDQVEQFLNDVCKVNKSAKVETEKLYETYEAWVIDKSYEMLGRKSFLETLFSLAPYAAQKVENGKVFVQGIRIGKLAA